MKDLISVVLPVYNGEKYLRESIDSVIAQTYQNWELLIVDDCSTDSTALIAKEYAEKDSRIHYYLNEKNLRLPRNLNRGFSLAKGDYLTWTSDDNKYRPTALEKMLKAIKESDNAQFAFASCRIIDGDGKPYEYIMVSEKGKDCIVGSDCVGACFMYTREVYETVGDYDYELELVEDFDYWQRVFMKFPTVAIEEILYDYRLHDGNLTNTMRKDKFNRNLEKMLLKNISGFGKLSGKQKYYYYTALHKCHENDKDVKNPYEKQYKKYKAYFFWRYRLPGKINRVLHGKP
ncbi:MAG: glycosyltransferase family 2 protein [Acutalibacteraceae bacterium]|nr:glycosyltransferase family 2 protein [Acutalibacteraceae bacterium]